MLSIDLWPVKSSIVMVELQLFGCGFAARELLICSLQDISICFHACSLAMQESRRVVTIMMAREGEKTSDLSGYE